jgi:hypothetical protein
MQTLEKRVRAWILFLRGYGPLPAGENKFDEHIQPISKKLGITPLRFEHPVNQVFQQAVADPTAGAVVLTGTAGDGKTNLCRAFWIGLGGSSDAFESKNPYLRMERFDGLRTLHLIKDLSAWVPQRNVAWSEDKRALIDGFCAAIAGETGDALYVIAANDGQLIESLRRLDGQVAQSARDQIEDLLVRNASSSAGLRLFNLSTFASAKLFERAYRALIEHEAWGWCAEYGEQSTDFFSANCPIRHNFELLCTPMIYRRIHDLMRLCDLAQVHIPIRQILLLLANALLGHPRTKGVNKEDLLRAEDVQHVLRAGTMVKASLYANVLGLNLSETDRERRLVFEALARFGIGSETSNRVDNVLIYGSHDDRLRGYFERLLESDPYYGATSEYLALQQAYFAGEGEDEGVRDRFLADLTRQRCRMFFCIPDDEADELGLWQLTVFHHAGQYLHEIANVLEGGGTVRTHIVQHLVRGLNRVFTGMLLTDSSDLLLAVNITNTQGRVSELLEDRVSLERRGGEAITLEWQEFPHLVVALAAGISRRLELNLTRFEFLMRVADGALPSSFSKECYEDILAFKGQLLSALNQRRKAEGSSKGLKLKLLRLNSEGQSLVRDLAVHG